MQTKTKLENYRNLKVSGPLSVMTVLLILTNDYFILVPGAIVSTILLFYLNRQHGAAELKKRHQREVETLRRYALEQDLAVIQCCAGVTFAENSRGEPVPWTKNIKDSVRILPEDDFFKIRRNYIVRRDMIVEVVFDERVNRMQLCLKPPFGGNAQLSKETADAFIIWWRRKEGMIVPKRKASSEY